MTRRYDGVNPPKFVFSRVLVTLTLPQYADFRAGSAIHIVNINQFLTPETLKKNVHKLYWQKSYKNKC